MIGRVKKALSRVYKSRGARNSAASYFAFGSNILWGLVTIPLAVKYLDKEEIGLWAIVSTFVAYLSWMDLGISRSTGRLVAPAVTSSNNDELNQWWSLIKTTLCLQAILLIVLGALIIPSIPTLIGVDHKLVSEAIQLLYGACIITAVALPIKSHMGLLTAQDRYHWIPMIEAASLWVNLIVFYIMLTSGHGTSSYLAALASGQFLLITSYCIIIRIGPHRPKWHAGGISWKRFKYMFCYSGNHALAGISDTITRTLPNVIIGRLAGLSMIPNYNFSSKAPMLGSQVICRTYYSFFPGLQNQYVSGQKGKFENKFEAMGVMTVGLCTIGAGIVLLGNRSLVTLLSAESFYAGHAADLWFAITAIAYPTADIYRSLMTISGNMRNYGLISLLKCLLAALLGIYMWYIFELSGIAFTFAVIYLVDGTYSYIYGIKNCKLSGKGPALRILLQAVAAIIITAACYFVMAGINQPRHTCVLWGKEISIINLYESMCTLPIFIFGIYNCINAFIKGMRQHNSAQ